MEKSCLSVWILIKRSRVGGCNGKTDLKNSVFLVLCSICFLRLLTQRPWTQPGDAEPLQLGLSLNNPWGDCPHSGIWFVWLPLFPLTMSIFSSFGSSSWQSCFSLTNYSAHSGFFHHNQRWARVFILCMQLEVIPFDWSTQRHLNACGSSLKLILRMSHGLVFQICLIGHLLFMFSVKWPEFNQIVKSSSITTVMEKWKKTSSN